MSTSVLEREPITSKLEEIIPSVKGEFYSYEADFSLERPFYFILKCKANKAWPMTTDREILLAELDLVFLFGDGLQVSAPSSPESVALLEANLGRFDHSFLNSTEVRIVDMPASSFELYYETKEPARLVEAFGSAGSSAATVHAEAGTVCSLRTASNKYGLFTIERLAESECRVKACHVQL